MTFESNIKSIELYVDLPRLKSLSFRDNALVGDENNKKWENGQNVHDNKLTMRSICCNIFG